MEFKILKQDKNELEAELDNLTIIELLRAYLARDDDVTVAWRREHPDKKPVLKLTTKSKSPKKALQDAINTINKELDKLLADVKKAK